MSGHNMKRTYFPGITDIVVVTDPVEREELRRKIAARTPNAGAHATAIPGLTLYHRTAPSPCYPAMCEDRKSVV